MTAYKYLPIRSEHSYFITSDRRCFIECPANLDGYVSELIAMANLDFSMRYTGAELYAVCSSWPGVTCTYTVTSLECAVNLIYDLSCRGQIARYNNHIEEDEDEEDFS